MVRANLKRVMPLLIATAGVIKLGICVISLLNVFIGSWISIFPCRRRLLSLLNVATLRGNHLRIPGRSSGCRMSWCLSLFL